MFVIQVNSAGHATSSLARCGTMSEPTKRLFVRSAETCLFPFQSGFSPSVLANSMRPYVCHSRKRSMTGLNGWHRSFQKRIEFTAGIKFNIALNYCLIDNAILLNG